ncbi:hypothetical protein GCM10012282_09380 [Streptomyces lacrimifluminis]|uniref:Uncharacterized protein n=1 Tax=Streptomyces lacrimifluminis TaxID=1500077 RepID=A0A917KM91_9ACTN|nr:hypothetical protein GCM10012282_09380 [Streptomyces lacrimifluminis]
MSRISNTAPTPSHPASAPASSRSTPTALNTAPTGGCTGRNAARTPTGRLATTVDVVDAVDFLLCNRSVNATDLSVGGEWLPG